MTGVQTCALPISSWDRDDRPRAREPLPPSRAQEREEEKPRQVSIPPVISWFVGDLPSASSFDGEIFFYFFFLRRDYYILLLIGSVFRTDDLLNLFRNAVMPSMTRSRAKSYKGGGGSKPAPDYGPYQGPTGSRGRRRY